MFLEIPGKFPRIFSRRNDKQEKEKLNKTYNKILEKTETSKKLPENLIKTS